MGVAVFILIVAMTLRPWADANTTADTHLNYNGSQKGDPRSEVAMVGDLPGGPVGWARSSENSPSDDAGRVDYVALACAACHGVQGEGGPAGPPIAGAKTRRIKTLTRKGPGQMPAYHEAYLEDPRLEAISSFLSELPEPPEPTPLAIATATPYPLPTPTPTPTPTPSPTPTPTPTPLPPDAPTPTPTPSPTPTPTPDPAKIEAGHELYVIVGCDLCHGANAEGAEDGPDLYGLDAKQIRDFTRDPESDPKSEWPKPMDPYPEQDLSDEELEQIIYYLTHLEE